MATSLQLGKISSCPVTAFTFFFFFFYIQQLTVSRYGDQLVTQRLKMQQPITQQMDSDSHGLQSITLRQTDEGLQVIAI